MIVVVPYDTVAKVWYNPQVHENDADFKRWAELTAQRDPIFKDKKFYLLATADRHAGYKVLAKIKEIKDVLPEAQH